MSGWVTFNDVSRVLTLTPTLDSQVGYHYLKYRVEDDDSYRNSMQLAVRVVDKAK